MSSFPWMRAALIGAAWLLVGVDFRNGGWSIIGLVAATWLGAQSLALGLCVVDIGIPANRFWSIFAETADGSICNKATQRWAWFCFGLLSHFSLIRNEQWAGKVVEHQDGICLTKEIT